MRKFLPYITPDSEMRPSPNEDYALHLVRHERAMYWELVDSNETITSKVYRSQLDRLNKNLKVQRPSLINLMESPYIMKIRGHILQDWHDKKLIN